MKLQFFRDTMIAMKNGKEGRDMEEPYVFPREDALTATQEIERLIRWLVTQGYSYEDAYRCIAYMAWGDLSLSQPKKKIERPTVQQKGGK